jgi:phage protein U
MWAQIGDIRVEIITIFKDMEGQHGHDFPQHDVIEGKPLLQWMGGKLSSYRLKFHLHCGMTRSPRAQFEILKKLMDDHKAVPFLKGNGTYLGQFVVTELTDNYLFESDKGSPIEMEGEMTLLEYAFESAQEELNAKAAAMRSATLKPNLPNVIPTVVTLPTDTPSILAQAINGINQSVQGLGSVLGDLTGISSSGLPTTLSMQELLGSTIAPLNRVMQVFGEATGELANVSGAVSTVTLGTVDMSGALDSVNTVTNSIGDQVMSANKIFAALGSVTDNLSSITRQ